MKNGYKIIDTDTHVGPNLETLKLYASDALLARWSEFDPFLQPVTLGGHFLSVAPFKYGRELGTEQTVEAAQKGGDSPLRGAVTKTFTQPPVPEGSNLDSKGRLDDMDIEGIDVNLIIPGTFGNAATTFDVPLAVELYDAYHRYIDEYCSVDQDRLKASLQLPANAPEEAVRMVKEYGDKKWLAAVSVVLPEGMPIDDPTLYPIWSAIGDYDLPLLHHSFFYEPPYFPGYRDIWGNLAIARAASHPWGAQRLLAYSLLSGMFDEYPNLRIGFAECSSGWVAGWLNRLDYQQAYLSRTLPETKLTPTEYARSGRVFCGVELDEGEAITQSVIDVVGDGVLMYSSDYPHGGCKYPTSPDVVLGWKGLGDETMRKLMSTNASNYLRM